MVDDSSEAKPNSPRKGRRMASNLSEYKQLLKENVIC